MRYHAARSLLFAFFVAGCGGGSVGQRFDLSGEGDLSFDFPDGGGPCSDSSQCPAKQRCYQSMCIPDNGTCTSDDECQNDTYCDCTGGGGGDAGPCTDGVCVPYGTGPRGPFDQDCRGGGFAAGDFKPPVTSCHWTPTKGETGAILMTPLVVDLDLDGKPEIVFSTYQDPTALVAIHGADCKPYFENTGIDMSECSELAAADLDGDKFPELVGITRAKLVVVFDHTGKLIAKSPTPYIEDFQGDDCSGVAIGDVDLDGKPELLVSGQVLRFANGQLTSLWNKPPSTGICAHWGTLSLFADMDGDGKPEAVTGLKVYDGATGADKTPAAMGTLGTTGAYPQVADFNGDKKPDILLVQSQPGQQQVSVTDFANNKVIFGPYKVSGGGWGGPAVVADFDGDGVPDFGLSSSTQYFAYALKCAKMPKPADCTGLNPGTLWERNTHDSSSGGTASSVFDFNGDGKAEVVYRDECWLRVMNGPDGKTVFAQSITSGTALEMPVVADVDSDGHADLIVPSGAWNGCPAEGTTGQQFGGSTDGLFVLRDPMNRWMPSRAIWNQHTYHITNINDNATVPAKEMPNWLTFNNYRQNVQGTGGGTAPQSDLTGGRSTSIDNGGNDCKTSERLWANLCNRGTAPAAAGVPGTFYTSDPRMNGAMVICSTKTTKLLQPGDCEAVFCDWLNPPQMAVDIWFRADDDGVKANFLPECHNGNDLLFLPGVQCFVPG